MKLFLITLLSAMLLATPARINAERASRNHRNHHTTEHHPAPPSTHLGLASWDGMEMCIRPGSKKRTPHCRKMANGVTFDPSKLTAASRTLPFGTLVRVTDIRTGLSVVVTIADRGPFVHNRVIDLTAAAARKIKCNGVCYVRLDWDMPEIAPTEDFGPSEPVADISVSTGCSAPL